MSQKTLTLFVSGRYKRLALAHLLPGMSFPQARNQDARSFAVYVLLLLMLSGLGLVPAFIAHYKGHSFAVWWVYGALVFIVALPHSLLMGSNSFRDESTGAKSCPYCHESVPLEDDVCPACHLHLYDPVFYGPPIGSRAAQGHVEKNLHPAAL